MLFDKLIPSEAWQRLMQRKGAAKWLGLAGLVALIVGIEWCETAAITKVAHDAVTGCSENQASMTARADAIFAKAEERYGPPTKRLRNGDEVWYERVSGADKSFGRFELSLNDHSDDPCYWEMSVAAYVTDAGAEAQALALHLDSYEVRRIYERVGRFVARQDGSIWLVKSEPLRTTHAASFFWLEDHLDLADHWGRVWMPEVRENRGKDAGARRESQWRPGRDPKSVLDGVEAFLRDAGVRD